MPILIAQDSWIQIPWRNGLGVTHVIWPQPDSEDYADLQIHRSPITKAGPFSFYNGFERILVLVAGNGLVLTIDGETLPVQPFMPVRFAGEAQVEAQLGTDAVEVFNVMYPRDRWREAGARSSSPEAGLAIVHCCTDTVSVFDGTKTETLANADTLLAEWPVLIRPEQGKFAYIRLDRL